MPADPRPQTTGWRVERSAFGKSWVVVRSMRPGFVQYLDRAGGVRGKPCFFRSREAANTTLERETALRLQSESIAAEALRKTERL